jgi:transcriptional coactivator YAP1
MAFPSSSSNQSQQQLKAPCIDEEGGAQGKKNLIILVDKDSNDKLDELFEQTLSNKTTLHKPYKMRKLPASFFQPPSSGSKSPSVSHSRENSADSAFGSGTTILGSNNTATPPNSIPSKQPATNPVTRELIHHSRAHSSPASLGKLPPNINLNLSALTLGSATQASPTHPNSGNPTSNPNTPNKHQPLKLSNPSIITSNTILEKTMQHNHSRGRSYDISSLQQQLHFGDLPPGWEQAKTHDGKIYYIK